MHSTIAVNDSRAKHGRGRRSARRVVDRPHHTPERNRPALAGHSRSTATQVSVAVERISINIIHSISSQNDGVVNIHILNAVNINDIFEKF